MKRLVKTFRERAPNDPKMNLLLPQGYNPNAERPLPAQSPVPVTGR